MIERQIRAWQGHFALFGRNHRDRVEAALLASQHRVGSHQQVAEKIQAFHNMGIEHFILSGQPHLEEAYWFAEGAGALLRRSGLLASP